MGKFEKARHLLKIDDEDDDLAKQVMDVSPASTSNPQISFTREDLKNSIRSEHFFLTNLDKVNAGHSTSFEEL